MFTDKQKGVLVIIATNVVVLLAFPLYSESLKNLIEKGLPILDLVGYYSLSKILKK